MRSEPVTQEQPHGPESDHQPHTAPAEHYPVKRSLWQRWMAWSGSFLVISILLHVLLLGGATLLVVQVVQGRKEKLKFTAPPPSAAGPSEHKVKPSKRSAATAPEISKRITSSAANASIALPSMDLASSSGPDVMASLMSGMSAANLGGGVGGAGGMASMPLTGLTAFGFKGNTGGTGLVGHIYDLKQTKDGQPTNIKDDGLWKNPHLLDHITDGYAKWNAIDAILYKDNSSLGKRADLLSDSIKNHAAVINEFLNKNWDESVLKRYYESKEALTAFQIFIPKTPSEQALKAFGAEREIKPTHFVIYYKGTVRAPRDGDFRFRAVVRYNCGMFVRFDGMNVFGARANPLYDITKFKFPDTDKKLKGIASYYDNDKGRWFHVEAGKKYPIEIMIENGPGDFFECLMIEERSPEKPYPRRHMSQLFPQDDPTYAYPVFALNKGVPIPPYDKTKITATPPPNHPNPQNWRPEENIPETAPGPLIFQGTK